MLLKKDYDWKDDESQFNRLGCYKNNFCNGKYHMPVSNLLQAAFILDILQKIENGACRPFLILAHKRYCYT